MRLHTCLLAIAAMVSMQPTWASAEETALAAPPTKIDLQAGDSIVFLGDSITHQCLYTQYLEDYFVTRLPQMKLKFHNSGVGGDRANDALVRFERDVAFYKPKYVTILLGMNDFGYQGYNDALFQTYQADMTKLIERVVAIGAKPILLTPTMFDARAARANKSRPATATAPLHNSVLAFYGAFLRETAVERGYGFADLYSPLNSLTLETRKQEPNFTMIRDAVHPDPPGQAVMAAAVIGDLGLPRSVARITITRGAKNESQGTSGGKVSGLQFTSDGLEFQWLGNSLPLVLPEEADRGVALTRLGHRLSQQALEVHGLEPGSYRLLIDGEAVGTYAHNVLERHVELQANAKTPQYQQALTVAMLNKQRNDEVIRPLRNLWRDQKILNRARATLKDAPNDEKAQAQVTQLEKTLADKDAKLAAFDAKAQELLDNVYSQAQPKPQTFKLVRVIEKN